MTDLAAAPKTRRTASGTVLSVKDLSVEFPSEDADRAQGFWQGLFGWSFQDSGMPGMDYRMAQAGAGGVAVYPSDQRAGHPNFYFATDDIDASIWTVRELGGQAEDRAPDLRADHRGEPANHGKWIGGIVGMQLPVQLEPSVYVQAVR